VSICCCLSGVWGDLSVYMNAFGCLLVSVGVCDELWVCVSVWVSVDSSG